jgi:hypothetical protein
MTQEEINIITHIPHPKLSPEFDVRKPAKNEYSKGLEAFLERAYILNKP